MTRSKRRPKAKAAEEAEATVALLRESAHARHLRAQQILREPVRALTPEEEAILTEERDCMTFWRWAGVVLILAACVLIALILLAMLGERVGAIDWGLIDAMSGSPLCVDSEGYDIPCLDDDRGMN